MEKEFSESPNCLNAEKLEAFTEDWREKNPELHLLYVKNAVRMLTTIDRCMFMLGQHCNVNMWDFQMALFDKRAELVKSNAAFFDADEILRSIAEDPETYNKLT